MTIPAWFCFQKINFNCRMVNAGFYPAFYPTDSLQLLESREAGATGQIFMLKNLLFVLAVTLAISANNSIAQDNNSQSNIQSSDSSQTSSAIDRGYINPECKFDYWQVIPDETECDVFYLPDFDFRRLPEDPKVDLKLKRFCESFEIRYGITSRVISYCKDPDKDGSGPSFEIDGRLYQADIYFEGCYKGKSTYGKVFINNIWSSSPSNISRIWRMKDRNFRLPDCSKVK